MWGRKKAKWDIFKHFSVNLKLLSKLSEIKTFSEIKTYPNVKKLYNVYQIIMRERNEEKFLNPVIRSLSKILLLAGRITKYSRKTLSGHKHRRTG